jgi:2,3-bisphosphoglycerate-dependent phosphoglycerate mutase
MVQLILLRHGESIWNRDNRFTGWTDVDLSDKGVGEAHRAAALLKMRSIVPDWCCTSYLKRAIRCRAQIQYPVGHAAL